MKKIILSLLVVLTLTSCYRMKLNSMLNLTKEELLIKWGIPHRTYKLNQNVELLMYKKSEKEYMPPAFRTDMYADFPAMWESKCETTFVVKNGIVTNYNYRGQGCY